MTLIDPRDPPERQVEKLGRICEALMDRVEGAGDRGAAYGQFQRAVLLEGQVRERTRDLQRALDLLNEANARLARAGRETERARSDLAGAIETIQEGFALFDEGDRLSLCNSRFGMHLPDIRAALRPGIGFGDYVALVSNSAHLDLPPGDTREAWAAGRLARHRDAHAMLLVRMTGDRWTQVSEHRMAGGQTVVMQTDVTGLVRAEREEQGRILDDQARLVRATLEHVEQGLCIVDRDGRLAGFNRRLAALLAIPLTRLHPGADFDVVLDHLRLPQGDRGCRLRAWRDAPSPRAPFRADLASDGAPWLDVFAAETPDGGLVLTVTDVSDARAATRALAEANERLEARVAARTLELEDALAAAERAHASRTRFVAAASHDLLQPLSAAKLYLAAIGDDLPAHQREVVGKAQNALGSVQDIIEALLDISKLEGGRATADLRPVDLHALLAQLRDEFAPAARAKGLLLDVVPSTLRVVSDPAYAKRILQNLVANAVRYTDAGRVLVGVRRAGGAARIEVRDSGPGIPPADHEAIFREFHRLGRRASASEGLGLGLAIVERACAMLGHPLTLESAVGRGTTFAVTMPLAERAAPPEVLRAATTGWRHDDLTILLVEDDGDMRRALALLLGHWGVRVVEAGSAAEALRLVERGARPDALLVDHQLDDGGTGLDAIARLRGRLGPLPARVVTADRAPEVARDAWRLGVEVLPKPLDPLLLHLFLGSVTLGRAG